ncbi:MAG: hypothetical protein H7328_01185 [Bdellovibrio sp.]|nr:hypothetical protein [Bdellovibrio sp.]
MKFVQILTLKKILLLFVLTTSLFHQHAYAQEDVDEAFDPFSDYNEFEQDAEEEADINFFKNGRYLTLGFLLGYRGYTEGFSQAYAPALAYGVQFSYFFDLQVAMSLGYSIGDSNVKFKTYTDQNLTNLSNTYTGNVNIQNIDLSIKYYFNTENVTRGLGDLNPYVFGGVGQYIRTYNIAGQLEFNPDQVIGFKVGGGLEIPLLRHRAYLGVQGTYHYVQFPDENNNVFTENKPGGPSPSIVSPSFDGDVYDLSLILGFNF